MDREIETPNRRLVEEAIDAGDAAAAKAALQNMVQSWERNKEYSINWITSLLSFIGRRLGEPAVEEALRDFGERYLRERRALMSQMEPRQIMESVVRGMKANFGEVILDEDDEKWILSFRCGSGGKLIDDGAYEAPRDYLTLREKGPQTFGRESLPVYCAHCSVNNEIQPIEWHGVPGTVEFPPEKPGERCVHHIYKDPARVPEEIYRRVGKRKP